MKWTSSLNDTTKSHTEEIDNLNRCVPIKKIESIINNFPKKESTRPRWFHWRILPNIQGTNDTNSLQSLPENRSRGNTHDSEAKIP